MALFSGLSERINHIFSKLSNRGALTELEIKQAMREVRVALLEADVNVSVAKQFIADVSEKAVGEQVLKSLTPAQQVIKIVNEQLTELRGPVQSKLKVASRLPTVIMMCGLQGAGKTTMCGKLAVYLKKQGKNPLLVGCDIYRPAAIEQLRVVSGKAKAGFFEMGQINPSKIAVKAVEYAKANGYDGVASVLGVSRYKNLAQVHQAAARASEETGIPYVQIEGPKGGMQERRSALIKELNLYNQDYCGCKPRH